MQSSIRQWCVSTVIAWVLGCVSLYEETVRASDAGAVSDFAVQTFQGGPAADEVLARCESMRRTWRETWLRSDDSTNWQHPCEIVVHRHRTGYVRAVGRAGATTLGSSLVRRTKGQPVVRRIDLLATAENDLPALAHELAHILLSDVFPEGSPPLWIDEGLATLFDSPSKQQQHWRDCHRVLDMGTALPLLDLLQMDRPPSPGQFPAVYGQSLSLARFLIQRRSPDQLIAFVHHARRAGYADALREIYDLESIDELEVAWRRFVRSDAAGPSVSMPAFRSRPIQHHELPRVMLT